MATDTHITICMFLSLQITYKRDIHFFKFFPWISSHVRMNISNIFRYLIASTVNESICNGKARTRCKMVWNIKIHIFIGETRAVEVGRV